MRADPAEYRLVSPGNLQAVLFLLAGEPAQWLPIAGGTDVMVLYSAGKLPNRNLINICNIPELQQIDVFPDRIRIGAACTYTALREHEIVSTEFPLLATAETPSKRSHVRAARYRYTRRRCGSYPEKHRFAEAREYCKC